MQKWCKNAILRRDQIEQGLDITFSEVLCPYILSQIQKKEFSRVLEIGAGTGHLSLQLAKLFDSVDAIEPSEGMFKVASEVISSSNVNLSNIAMEEVKRSNYYDLLICNMCVQTIENLDIFFQSVSNSMIQDGVFIFTLPHPCFYNGYKKFFDESYRYMNSQSKIISFKITKDDKNPIEDVPYFHRPLSFYIKKLSHFFSILSFDEIYPTKEIEKKYGTEWQVPRYCAFKVKKFRVY